MLLQMEVSLTAAEPKLKCMSKHKSDLKATKAPNPTCAMN